MNKKLLHTLLSIFLAFFISSSVKAQNIFTPTPSACNSRSCTFQGPAIMSKKLNGIEDLVGQCLQVCNATSGCNAVTVYQDGICNLYNTGQLGAKTPFQFSASSIGSFIATPAQSQAPAPAVSAAVISDLTNKITQLTAQVAALTQQQATRPDPKPAIDALTTQMAQVKAQVDKQTQQLATPPIPVSGVSAAVITDLTNKINLLSKSTNDLPAQLNLFMQKNQNNVNQIRNYANCVNNFAQFMLNVPQPPDIKFVNGGKNLLLCQQILSNLQP